MKTYKEAIDMIAENAFHNEMGGGQGRIDTGLIGRIYEVNDETDYNDAKALVEEKFTKYYNKNTKKDK